MKHLTLIVITTVVATLSSCANKKQCVDFKIGLEVAFNSGTPIFDDSVSTVAYKKNTNLSVVDSSIAYHWPAGTNDLTKIIGWPYFSTNFTQEDWKITLYPSGKQYIITNAHFNSRKAVVYNYASQTCTNDLSYTINNTTVNIAGSLYDSQPQTVYLLFDY